jgi:hypothetical protein
MLDARSSGRTFIKGGSGMLSNKAVMLWVLSVIISLGMLFVPNAALAHGRDHDRDDWHHQWHDNGHHEGWYNHHGHDWHENEEEEEHEHRGYYQHPYPYGYGSGWTRPNYGSRWNGPVNEWNNSRHPGLMWACDSHGHHCHWARRLGYSSAYPQGGPNPYAFDGSYGEYPSYGNPYYGNEYYGNYSMGGLDSLLGPLLYGQQR